MNFMKALETTSETANTFNPQNQKYRSERLFSYNLMTYCNSIGWTKPLPLT